MERVVDGDIDEKWRARNILASILVACMIIASAVVVVSLGFANAVGFPEGAATVDRRSG